MTEDDLKQLYAQVLELSHNIPHCERLQQPQATVTMVSPLCGSQVTVDLCLEDGRVTQFGQKVRACTLGAAAASIVAAALPCRSAQELRVLRQQMQQMLKEDGPPPDGVFSQLALLEPARDLISRHGSIMLIFDALCEALDEIQGVKPPTGEPAKGIPDTVRA